MGDTYRSTRFVRRAVLLVLVVTAATWWGGRPAAAGVPTPRGAGPPVVGRAVSADPADWTPQVLDGAVDQVIQAGDRMYAAGSFTRIADAGSGSVLRVRSLAAFDARTGVVDRRFLPRLDGPATTIALAADGRSLYVGGEFTHLGAARAAYLTRVAADTGAAWPGFHPAALDGPVSHVLLLGRRLVVGGSFQTVDATVRPALASLDPATGVATGDVDLRLAEPRTTPSGATAPIKVTALAATPDQRRLILGGNFDEAAGRPRYQLAVADLTANPVRLADWTTTRYQPMCSDHFPTYLRGLAVAPTGTWFTVATTGGARQGQLCDSVARFDLTGGGTPTWVNWTGGDTLLSTAITDTAVYVGGHQRWLDNPQGHDSAGPGAVPRPGIGAVSVTDGRALAWDPTKDRGVGVFCILPTAAGLWITSDTTHVHGEYHARIAFFPNDSDQVR